jgi:hypothetical protein
MKNQNLIQTGGIAAILVSLLNLVTLVLGDARTPAIMWVTINLLILAVLTGIFLFLREDGRSTLLTVGFVSSVVGDLFLLFDYSDHYFALEATVLAIGLAILAGLTLKGKKFPRWVPYLLILACLIGVTGLVVASVSTVFRIIANILFSISFLGFGYYMWARAAGEHRNKIAE